MKTKILDTKYQILNTSELKKFVREFNFPDPNWDSLPPNFPNIPMDDLSVEEKHLFEAIKLAWFANEGGKILFFRKLKVILLVFISFIGLIGLIFSWSQEMITKPVQAATTQIDNVIQSTMSAILRK